MPQSQSAELRADSGRMVTEYKARFLAHSSTAAQKLRKAPENFKRPEVKMTDMTAFRSDIMPHDVTRRDPKLTEAHHFPPEGAVKHTSTYVHDYKAYSIQQNTVTNNIAYSPPSAKMDVRSTYKEEFQSWDTPLQRAVGNNSNLKLSHKFNMTVPFLEHCCSKVTPAAGKSWNVTPSGEKALPFESTTSYKLHYICHPPQPKRLIQRLVYKPSSSPLNCVTTYRQDYRCLQVDVVKPIRSKATWENNPAPCQGCPKLRDKCKTWPLRLTCGNRTVVDASPKDEVELISTTLADFVVRQGQALPSTHTPRQAWTTDKVSLEALSSMGEKCWFWETKKVLPIAQPKEPDKLVEVLKNAITCPSQGMPKTLVFPLTFQSQNCSVPGMASTAGDITKETQPCSERGYRVAWGDGNKLQRTPSARESSAARIVETNSRKPKCTHGAKTPTVQSAVLTRRKRAN